MRIVIDTNIVFSAILNTNSKIARIILRPKSGLNFYATDSLDFELEEHKQKLMHRGKLTNEQYRITRDLITRRIKLIHVELIPIKTLTKIWQLTSTIDEDDTEFVGLTEHIKGKLWTGDKQLIKGLSRLGWDKFITTAELYDWKTLKK
jgi:predicted nucleic acid-binding protein